MILVTAIGELLHLLYEGGTLTGNRTYLCSGVGHFVAGQLPLALIVAAIVLGRIGGSGNGNSVPALTNLDSVGVTPS